MQERRFGYTNWRRLIGPIPSKNCTALSATYQVEDRDHTITRTTTGQQNVGNLRAMLGTSHSIFVL